MLRTWKKGLTSKMSFRRRGSFAKTLRSVEPEFGDYELDGGYSAAVKNQWYFEVAWEVANKGKTDQLN